MRKYKTNKFAAKAMLVGDGVYDGTCPCGRPLPAVKPDCTPFQYCCFACKRKYGKKTNHKGE